MTPCRKHRIRKLIFKLSIEVLNENFSSLDKTFIDSICPNCKMGAPTFFQQFLAMTYRCLLLKRRNWSHTMREILFPLYFIGIIVVIMLAVQPKPHVRVDFYPLVDAVQMSPTDKIIIGQMLDTIAVAPQSNVTQTFAEHVAQCMTNITGKQYRLAHYESGQSIQDHYMQGNLTRVVGLVLKLNSAGDGVDPSYELKFPSDYIPSGNFHGVHDAVPNDVMNYFVVCPAPAAGSQSMPLCTSTQYYYSGFASMQHCTDAVFLSRQSPTVNVPHMKLQLMPRPSIHNVGGAQWFGFIAPVYILFSLCFMIMFLVIYIVDEKEKKLQELLRMVGVRTSAYWLGWFCPYFVIFSIVSTIMITIMRLVPDLLTHSNLLIIFMLFILAGVCLLSYGLMLVPFFSNANVAAPAVMGGVQLTSLLFLAFKYADVPKWLYWVFALGGNLSFIFALDQVFMFEYAGVGVQWSNINSSVNGKFTCLDAVIMLCIDILLYTILALYFDNVIPTENGARAHPLYFVSIEYWRAVFGMKSRAEMVHGDMESMLSTSSDGGVYEQQNQSFSHAGVNPQNLSNIDPNVESMPPGLKIGAFTRGLTKTFSPSGGWFKKPASSIASADSSTTSKNAVDNLTVALYQNQITAILGHNGAGKSTLIGLLNGLVAPSSGNASVLGFDISQPGAIDRVRAVTGVCTQHDALWASLTVREHLTIFAMLKAVKNVRQEVECIVDEVELREKLDVQTKALSGGMKRRLCCALAMVGSPRVMFLDEPTSGVDPYSKRKMWDVLKRRRQQTEGGCMIVLTTHSMHEADVLADRKVMLSHGKLRCAGSSMFLKNRFSLGYHVNGSVADAASLTAVQDNVVYLAPEITFGSGTAAYAHEFQFDLPKSTGSSEKLPGILEWLESQEMTTFGVKNVTVSTSSLEEVFLRLEHEEHLGGENSDVATTAFGSNLVGGRDGIRLNVRSEGRTPSPTSRLMNRAGSASASPSNYSTADVDDSNSGVRRAATLDKLWSLVYVRLLMTWRQPWKIMWRIGFSCAFIIGSGYLRSKTGGGSTAAGGGKPELHSLSISDLAATALSRKPSLAEQHPFIVKNDTPNASLEVLFSYLDKNNMANSMYTNTYAELRDEPRILYVGADIASFSSAAAVNLWTLWFNETMIHSLPVAINIINSAVFGQPIQVISTPLVSAQQQTTNQAGAMWAPIMFAFAVASISGYFTADIVRDKEIGARAVLKLSGASFWLYWVSASVYHIVLYYVPTVIALVVSTILFGYEFGSTSTVVHFVIILILHMAVMTLFAYVCSFLYAKQERAISWQPLLIMLTSFVPGMILPALDLASRELCTTVTTICCIIFPGVPLFTFVNSLLLKQMLSAMPVDLSYLDQRVNIAFACNAAHLFVLAFVLVVLEAYVSNVVSLPRWTKCRAGDTQTTNLLARARNDADYAVDTDVRHEAQLTSEAVRQLQQANSNEHFSGPPAVLSVLELRKEFSPSACQSCRNRRKKAGCVGGCMNASNDDETPKNSQSTSAGSLIAVRNVSFRVLPNEVFGLLGPNGAGKTTTISVIVGEERPTRGDVFVGSDSIQTNAQQARSQLGYCPQRDALWDLLTVAEHIKLYSTLRGARIVDPSRSRLFNTVARTLELNEHINKRTSALSGGTKRKLSFLIGITGGSNSADATMKSNVCLLDEPSTGMDPASKRFFWDIIRQTFHDYSGSRAASPIAGGEKPRPTSAILTTHSMEEADSLCDRLAIMVRGRVRCIGTSAHLKAKYAAGYTLEVKLNNSCPMNGVGEEVGLLPDPVRERVKNEIERRIFPGARLNSEESIFDRLVYEIDSVGKLSKAFRALDALCNVEKNRGVAGDVIEYVLGQNSLEQVFIKFAKEQEEGEEASVPVNVTVDAAV